MSTAEQRRAMLLVSVFLAIMKERKLGKTG
jgi:hypothetical protein